LPLIFRGRDRCVHKGRAAAVSLPGFLNVNENDAPSKPFWMPPGVTLDNLSEELRAAILGVLTPAYQKLVVAARPGLEQSTGMTVVHLLWLEILPGRPGYTAAPEDVIIGKLWYYQDGGSEKHLRDVAAMLPVSGDDIDREHINHWVQQLGFTEEWQTVLDRLRKQ